MKPKNQKVSVIEIDKGSSSSFFNGPLFTDKGSLTNGDWLIKEKFIPKNLLKRAITGENIPIPPEDGLWENVDKASPAKLLLSQDDPEYYIFTFDGGLKQKEIYFNKKYILFFQKHIKHFNLKAYDKGSPAYIYSGILLAGILMPCAYRNFKRYKI